MMLQSLLYVFLKSQEIFEKLTFCRSFHNKVKSHYPQRKQYFSYYRELNPQIWIIVHPFFSRQFLPMWFFHTVGFLPGRLPPPVAARTDNYNPGSRFKTQHNHSSLQTLHLTLAASQCGALQRESGNRAPLSRCFITGPR